MKLSQYFLPAIKETPADAELVSHRLMLRAGMIRSLASGVYSWLPLGLRVLQKVQNIVREEMTRVGACELLLPSIQPGVLWQETGRWDQYGSELLRFQDRHQREFCYGPTHEEVITDIMRKELRSYKQLPLTTYQIQTKFRDEIRPRFGVMRSREFIMKDAYSFHIDNASLSETYQAMFGAYTTIFNRLGLRFRAVLADTGSIGGEYSHEFQVLAESGEDVVAYSDESDYAANVERADALPVQHERPAAKEELMRFATPDAKTIKDLADQFSIPAERTLKTIVVHGEDSLVALVLRGDHELNEIKAEKLPELKVPFTMATEDEVRQALGVGFGSLGAVNLPLKMIVDRDASVLADFVCGANEDGVHYQGANWGRDCPCDHVADLRLVVEGDRSPDGQGKLMFARGIEVGHIFQLGDKYSRAMDLTVLGQDGKAKVPMMGCYGIGITRIVAAAIEQHHDQNGIVWPASMAPFQVAIIPLQMQKSFRVKELAEKIYNLCLERGIEVLMDDRRERPGVMFSTMDLIGIPHQIIIGERGIDQGCVEYKSRTGTESTMWSIEDAVAQLEQRINGQ